MAQLNSSKNVERILNRLASNDELQSPIVRWSVFFIVLIVLWFGVIEPLQSWRDAMHDTVLRNAQKAVRLSSLKEKSELWERAEASSIETLEKHMDSLFMQSSDTAAQAVLQDLIRQECNRLGIVIESQKLVEPEDYPGVGSKLSLLLNVKGELSSVLTLLDIVSHANHVIQVDRWFVRADRGNAVVSQMVISGFRGRSGDLNES